MPHSKSHNKPVSRRVSNDPESPEDDEEGRDLFDVDAWDPRWAMLEASAGSREHREPRGRKATSKSSPKAPKGKVNLQPALRATRLVQSGRREGKDRQQRERLQARTFKEMDLFFDLVGVPEDLAPAAQDLSLGHGLSNMSTTSSMVSRTSQDGILPGKQPTLSSQSLPQPTRPARQQPAEHMAKSMTAPMSSSEDGSCDLLPEVDDLLRSLLLPEEDVDAHQDQFTQFRQQAQAIGAELQVLGSCSWMGAAERLSELRSSRTRCRELLCQLDCLRRRVTQVAGASAPAARQELQASYDFVFQQALVPGLVHVVLSMQASVVELFMLSRTEAQVLAAADAANELLAAAEGIADDFLREPRTTVTPQSISTQLALLGDCATAIVDAAGKAACRLADSLLVRERLCHDVLTPGSSANWPKALSAAWQASATLLIEHSQRCWWLSKLQLEQQQLRYLLHAVKSAVDMQEGWHEEAQKRFWFEEEEVDLDRGYVGSLLEEKDVQMHAWVGDLLLALMHSVGALHCELNELIGTLSAARPARAGSVGGSSVGGGISGAVSFSAVGSDSFGSHADFAVASISGTGTGAGGQAGAGGAGGNNGRNSPCNSGSGFALDTAPSGASTSGNWAGLGASRAATLSEPERAACQQLLDDLQHHFTRLVMLNTQRMALLCARHRLLPPSPLQQLFTQCTKALQLFRRWDTSTLGLQNQGMDMRGYVYLGREHLKNLTNGSLRIKDALDRLQAAAPMQRQGIRESPFAKAVFTGPCAPTAPVMAQPPRRNAKTKPDLGRDTTLIPWSVLCKPLYEAGLKVLGSGSSGQVLLSHYDGQPVATKLMTIQDGLTDDNLQESFKKEVMIQQRLSHPNIVKLVGACWEDEEDVHGRVTHRLAIVMELCDCNLLEMVKNASTARDEVRRGAAPRRLKPLLQGAYRFYNSWAVRLEVAHGIAAGLEYMHRRECVHRDLTSYNVLLKQTDEQLLAKLCDFNYSQELAQGKQLVKSQRYANSPKWQSPEVLKGAEYSHATDVFSFGVILWEILTLEQPWRFTCPTSTPHRGLRAAQALHDDSIIEKVSSGSRLLLPAEGALQPALLAEGVATALLGIVSSCWREEPAERPPMREVTRSLKPLLDKTRTWEQAQAQA